MCRLFRSLSSSLISSLALLELAQLGHHRLDLGALAALPEHGVRHVEDGVLQRSKREGLRFMELRGEK